MSEPDPLLASFAVLVDYPDGDLPARAAECCGIARTGRSAAASLLEQFARGVGSMPLSRVQEAYVDAFDLDAACALDLGWHLYGDGPKRGEMLVMMRERLRAAGVAESKQLPDHLTHVLALLARVPIEERAALGAEYAGALQKIAEGLERRESVYAALIQAVQLAVASHSSEPTVSTGR